MKRQIYLIVIIIWLIALNLSGFMGISNAKTDDTKTDRVFTETAPPVGPVRPVAEWEPASQVLIRYPLGIPTALVVQLANTVPVICIVANASTQTQATSTFSSAGVNMANVSFMLAPTDSYWTRDYGPWFNVNGLNQVGIVDFPYNRPRPYDDEIPRTFATQYNYPLYGMNVVNTGGNYMTDGISLGAQTNLVYTENSDQTQAQIATKMLNYLGITEFNAIQDPNDTYIDHIDCWGKFLAPDKVLIRSVPSTHAQYDEIEATANFFATHNCTWGYPYKVYRVYTPQNQPYTNSLILNNKVFVPIMGSTNDAAALQSYRDALPGYEVLGITGASYTPWESTDALHCRVHEIADKSMLNIAHTPLHGAVTNISDISASILALSNTSLYADSTFICYKINQGAWQRSYLQNTSGNAYSAPFGAVISFGDTVRYFIHTADQSGRSLNHPYTAALDPHKFWLPQDTTPPVITHTPIGNISAGQLPLNLIANVTDNNFIQSVTLTYFVNDEFPVIIGDSLLAGSNYFFTISPSLPVLGGTLHYKFTATDLAGNISQLPAEGYFNALIEPTGNNDNVTHIYPNGINLISPNPFSRKTHSNINIQFTTKGNEQVGFEVFNLKGQIVKDFSVDTGNTGQHSISWNAKNTQGIAVSSGVYFIKMKTTTGSNLKKVLIID